jgi:hypothetical protein
MVYFGPTSFLLQSAMRLQPVGLSLGLRHCGTSGAPTSDCLLAIRAVLIAAIVSTKFGINRVKLPRIRGKLRQA